MRVFHYCYPLNYDKPTLIYKSFSTITLLLGFISQQTQKYNISDRNT